MGGEIVVGRAAAAVALTNISNAYHFTILRSDWSPWLKVSHPTLKPPVGRPVDLSICVCVFLCVTSKFCAQYYASAIQFMTEKVS